MIFFINNVILSKSFYFFLTFCQHFSHNLFKINIIKNKLLDFLTYLSDYQLFIYISTIILTFDYRKRLFLNTYFMQKRQLLNPVFMWSHDAFCATTFSSGRIVIFFMPNRCISHSADRVWAHFSIFYQFFATTDGQMQEKM